MAEQHRERGQVVRFLLLGGANTAVTYLAFVLLSQYMSPRVAYILVFAAGVALSASLAGSFVFRSKSSGSRSLLYGAWYVLVYGVGLAALELLERADVSSAAVLGLGIVAVTAPLTYLGGRLLFTAPGADACRTEMGS